jgi:hypothetical protein
VLTAIGLDDQPVFDAGEIDDVSGDGMLAAELEPGQPAVAQGFPQNALGAGFVAAQVAGERNGHAGTLRGIVGFDRAESVIWDFGAAPLTQPSPPASAGGEGFRGAHIKALSPHFGGRGLGEGGAATHSDPQK